MSKAVANFVEAQKYAMSTRPHGRRVSVSGRSTKAGRSDTKRLVSSVVPECLSD